MHRSPSQRFQRTNNVYITPSHSPRQGSPKNEADIKQSRQSCLGKDGQIGNNREDHRQLVDNKVENLQKMLQNQKQKRQAQFSQLYKMINSMKDAKFNRNYDSELSFNYNQLQFPMTPRVRNIETQEKQSHYQTYTPIIETASKTQDRRQRYYGKELDNYRNPQEHSLKSLEVLLQKIEREAEFNNRNIFRIQQQISSIRSIVSNSRQRSAKSQQIPVEIQKYIKESHNILKSQIQAEKNLMKKMVAQEVQQQVTQRVKQMMQEKTPNRRIQQLSAKIDEINLFFQQEVKILEEKSENQIDTFNQIIQEKFSFFKDSLLNQVLKDAQEDSKKLVKEIQKQRNRINQIEETNGQFFNELERTMANIQQTLRIVKQGNQNEQQVKNSQLRANLREEQDQFFKQMSQYLDKKMNSNFQQIIDQLRNLNCRIEKIENFIEPTPRFKVTKSNSLMNTKNTMGPDFDYQASDLSKISKFSNEHELSFQNCNKYIRNEDQQEIDQKLNSMLDLLSENCSFLQSRNCNIEQSMAEIVSVLNVIVEKLNQIM